MIDENKKPAAKSRKYKRSSPSVDEVRYWISQNWRSKYSGDILTWKEVQLMNPITTGSNPSWQNFNAKHIDIVFIADVSNEIWLIETDPTPFQSSFGQLLVYKKWYEILMGRDVVQNIMPKSRREKMNRDITALYETYAAPEILGKKNRFYLPGIGSNKTIRLALFVRETDIMIEELCARKNIRVIIIQGE